MSQILGGGSAWLSLFFTDWTLLPPFLSLLEGRTRNQEDETTAMELSHGHGLLDTDRASLASDIVSCAIMKPRCAILSMCARF